MRYVVLSALLVISSAAMAEPTQEQKEACQPDAAQFCQQVGTDEAKIGQCLGKNFKKLSAPCRQVMRFATIQKVCARQISAGCASAGERSADVVACLEKAKTPANCRNAVRAFRR